MERRRWLLLTAAVIGASVAIAAPAAAGTRGCGPRGYAYAGLQARQAAYGVSATLAATTDPEVEQGHVAGWIGVGASKQGPGGAHEWLQVGLNTLPGTGGNLYYEVAQPWGIRYVPLQSQIPAGRRFSVAVLEMAQRPDVWRVWVDDRPASPPIWLPRSHGALTSMVMTESWDGGQPACNRYGYSFDEVALAHSPGGAWARFRLRDGYVVHDTGYRVVPAAAGGFVAATGGQAQLTPAAKPPQQLSDRRRARELTSAPSGRGPHRPAR
jgi:hypothetical protein